MSINYSKWVSSGRAARGWSQSDLAQKAGITQTTISSIENSKPALPKTIQKIAEAFSKTPVIFSAGDDVAA